MSGIYFGIDVGGTSVKIGCFDGAGELVERREIPTRKGENGKYLFDDIAMAVLMQTVALGLKPSAIAGVGLGVPGPVLSDGFVETCVNLGVYDCYPAKEISERLGGVTVKLANDANVAALGEAMAGGAKGAASMAMITLGTGVGGGIVVDGKICVGAHGAAGEIGHLTVNPAETQRCNCGGRGCLEQYASATGVVRTARLLLAQSDAPGMLRGKLNLTAKDVFDAAKLGDELAGKAVDIMCDYLALAMSHVSLVSDPEVFIIGGGVSAAGEFLLEKLRTRYERLSPIMKRKAQVRAALLGNDAGIYGACRLVL